MKNLIKKSVKDIKSKLGDNLISPYLIGTAALSEKKVGDIDFFAIIKKADFDEEKLNKWLTKKYRFPIRLRAILYDEIIGKKKKATPIMKWGLFTVPELVEIFKLSKLVAGKQINFKKLPIKKLEPKEYLNFELRKVKNGLESVKNGKTHFPIKDFPKHVAYLARAEIYLKKKKFIMSYEEMSRQLKNQPEHIIHDCVAIRHGKKKLSKKFLNKVERYIKIVEKRLR